MSLLVSADDKPVDLCGLWRSSSAFLVGSGPSLMQCDPAFDQRGVLAMGINVASALVKCRAVVFTDPAEKIPHDVLLDANVFKFCPVAQLNKRVRVKQDGVFRLTDLRVRECPSVFGFRKTGVFQPASFLGEERVNIGTNDEGARATNRPKCIFTMFAGIKLLYYLGVRRIYLHGMDFHMPYERQYAHGNEHPEEFRLGNQEKYQVASQMLADVKPHFDDAGLEVFNTTENSRLTVFPHVSFSDAIRDCRGLISNEPDCIGWYDKRFKDGLYPRK